MWSAGATTLQSWLVWVRISNYMHIAILFSSYSSMTFFIPRCMLRAVYVSGFLIMPPRCWQMLWWWWRSFGMSNFCTISGGAVIDFTHIQEYTRSLLNSLPSTTLRSAMVQITFSMIMNSVLSGPLYTVHCELQQKWNWLFWQINSTNWQPFGACPKPNFRFSQLHRTSHLCWLRNTGTSLLIR